MNIWFIKLYVFSSVSFFMIDVIYILFTILLHVIEADCKCCCTTTLRRVGGKMRSSSKVAVHEAIHPGSGVVMILLFGVLSL